MVNLLAVDAKTFVYYKKNNIPITAYKADMKFSGWKGWGGSERDGKTTGVDVDRKVNFQPLILLVIFYLLFQSFRYLLLCNKLCLLSELLECQNKGASDNQL